MGKWIAGLGLVAGAIVAMLLWHPHVMISHLSKRYPDVLFFVPTRAKVVALSIDDAPSVETYRILDVLRVNDAKATFFIIGGNAVDHPAMLERIATAGHELGNHLLADRTSADLSPEEFTRELAATDTIIRTYQTPRWFRPGSGWVNDEMLASAKAMGYRCALGSVYPFDPHLPWTWYLKRFVLYAVRPGAIIVLHDDKGRGARTADVLADVLPALRAEGYSVVPISELVAKFKNGSGQPAGAGR